MAWPIALRFDEANPAARTRIRRDIDLLDWVEGSYEFFLVRRQAEGWVAIRTTPKDMVAITYGRTFGKDVASGVVKVLVVDVRPDRTVKADVAFEGASYMLQLRCSVTDALLVAERDVDVAAELDAYFHRAASAAFVGSRGVVTAEGVTSITDLFHSNPPAVPGISVGLVDVQPFVRGLSRSLTTLRAGGLDLPPPKRFGGELSRHASSGGLPLVDQIELALHEQPQRNLDGFIYTSGNDGSEIRRALARVAARYNYELRDEGGPQRGSWRQRLKAWFSADLPVLEHDQFLERDNHQVQQFTMAAQVRRHELDQVGAVKDLLAAVEKEDEVVIQLGSMVIVKYEGKLRVGTLQPTALAILSQNPDMLNSPTAMAGLLLGGTVTAGLVQRPHTPPRPMSPEP